MVAKCVTPIKARVARLVKLNECGVPVSGASSAVVVTKGWIQVSASPDYEEGDEFIQKLVTGEPCVNQKDPNFLKRVGLDMQWCVMDPDAIVIQTGERLLTTNGVTGTGVAYGESLLEARYSLELWQPIAGVGACDPSGNPQYVYWAFMNVGNGMVGDFTFQNGLFNYSISGETFATSTLWSDGPGTGTKYIDDPVEEGDHFLHNITTNAPPTPTCGAVLLS